MSYYQKLLTTLFLLTSAANVLPALQAANPAPAAAHSYTTSEKLQFFTAALRFPSTWAAGNVKSKKTKLYASLARALDNGLRLYNRHNDQQTSPYAITWFIADAVDSLYILTDIEKHTLSTAFDDTHYSKALRIAKLILLPLAETAASLYLSYENGRTEQALVQRNKAESILSLCRVADVYLNSKSVTAFEKITLITLLLHAAITTYELLPSSR